jgi:butyryl-CoA dehydrogenase
MAKQYVSARNLKFLLHEVFNVGGLSQYDYYKEHTPEAYDMVIDSAIKLADTHLRPYADAMDEKEPELVNGEVHAHSSIGPMMQAFGDGGWLVTTVPASEGGMQMPTAVDSCVKFIFAAANKTSSNFPGLLVGAARLILNFGDRALKDAYLPHMYAGKWQGTMCLTEPQAGSSLSDVKSSAEPNKDGSYNIKGTKIFISAGDYSSAENIVHLFLARVKGAPAGTKGISLFVVPKYRPEGGKLVPNDVQTAGLFHKMGERGIPTCHLVAGDNNNCKGWLVGQENMGLAYMFQMMNEARLGVGVGAAGAASAAYYASLEYANERPQGRPSTNRDPGSAQMLIIDHADIKRMLLFQKAVVEGSLSLGLECGMLADVEHVETGEAKERAGLLLDLLTPVCKTYPSEMSNLTIAAAMQVLGGYGFTRDFPIEMHYRDVKISTIYEGTTGIQGLDLLGRKVSIKGGAALRYFADEVVATIKAAQTHTVLQPYARQLGAELERVADVTTHLMAQAQQGKYEHFLADATLYLEMFGIGAIAWQWLKQGVAVAAALDKKPTGEEGQFYQSKLYALQYFFAYEVPKMAALAQRLKDPNAFTVEMEGKTLV